MNLQKIIVLTTLIFASCFLECLPAFGEGIELQNIHTNPPNIHVGDSFQINATVVNNSPDTIHFIGGCQSPLSATFENNVNVGHAISCFAIFNASLKPGESMTIVGPSSGILYTAISSGIINANITFSYQTGNRSENIISKLFTFDMSDGNVIPEFPLLSVAIFTVTVMAAIISMVSMKNHSLFKF